MRLAKDLQEPARSDSRSGVGPADRLRSAVPVDALPAADSPSNRRLLRGDGRVERVAIPPAARAGPVETRRSSRQPIGGRATGRTDTAAEREGRRFGRGFCRRVPDANAAHRLLLAQVETVETDSATETNS